MNKSPSFLSSSPITNITPTTVPPTTAASVVASSAIKLYQTPSIIPLDYEYRVMSPSSLSLLQRSRSSSSKSETFSRTQTAANQKGRIGDACYQCTSLFGDPVPPPELLNSDIDSRTAQFLNYSSIDTSGCSEEERNSGRSKPCTSLPRRCTLISTAKSEFSTFSPLPVKDHKHLEPPDVQLLPNSGSSNYEPRGFQNSNLLSPDNRLSAPTLFERADANGNLETITMLDTSDRPEYAKSSSHLRKSGVETDVSFIDFKMSFTSNNSVNQSISSSDRQFSDNPYDWFSPTLNEFSEFSKMPKLRPSSKNVMSIKNDEMPMQHSPVAAMINDSNGSSSGCEESLLNTTQILPESTLPLDILMPTNFQWNRSLRRRNSFNSFEDIFSPTSPAAPPPPICLKELGIGSTKETEEQVPLKRQMSPVVLQDFISTGGDFRVEQPRRHKKSSFTILSNRLPEFSNFETTNVYPKNLNKTSSSVSRFILQPLHNKLSTSPQIKLPQLLTQRQPSDDSPRLSVQFDMTRRCSPNRMPQKSILQLRDPVISAQETPLPPKLSQTPPPIPSRLSSLLTAKPIITMSSTMRDNQIDTSGYQKTTSMTDSLIVVSHLNRSSLDKNQESDFIPSEAISKTLGHNVNPTRKERGLLRIINSADGHRSIGTVSMDKLILKQRQKSFLTPIRLQVRRRSSSTSPSRRSSTQTVSDRRSSNLSTMTTSDFSFKKLERTNKPSFSTQGRRKSVFASISSAKRREPIIRINVQKRTPRIKVAKPTILSPIVGTPNKDRNSSHSPSRNAGNDTFKNASQIILGSPSKQEFISKIPMRRDSNSRSNSRLNAQPGSRIHSRSGSPLKDLTTLAPSSRVTSCTASSRSHSRATARTESRPVSQADSRTAVVSRSTLRASTKLISLESKSRGSSRPNSHDNQTCGIMESRPSSRVKNPRDLGNSCSNSVVNMRGLSVAPTKNQGQRLLTSNHQKSTSLKQKHRMNSLKLLKPHSKKQTSTETRSLGYRSRIPRAKGDISTLTKSDHRPFLKFREENLNRTQSFQKNLQIPYHKKPKSAKKLVKSIHKIEATVKSVAPMGENTSATATIKRQRSSLQKGVVGRLKLQAKNYQNTISKKGNKIANKKDPAKLSIKRKKVSNFKESKNMASSKQSEELNDFKLSSDNFETNMDYVDKALTHNPAIGAKTVVNSGIATRTPGSKRKSEPNEVTDAAVTATGALTVGLKNPTSTAALIRVGSRISLLSRKHPDSSLSRNITEEEEHETVMALRVEQSSGQLQKVDNAAQFSRSDELPSAILESRKILENTQKPATVDLQHKINENLTELKALRQDIGRVSDGAVSPTPSVATVVETKTVRTVTSKDSIVSSSDKSPQLSTQPIEASVSILNAGSSHPVGNNNTSIIAERVSATATVLSVLPEVDCESPNFQNFEMDTDQQRAVETDHLTFGGHVADSCALNDEPSNNSDVDDSNKQRRSPDGQGGSTTDSNDKRSDSHELLETGEKKTQKGCCRCCATFCIPCRRFRCSRCFQRNKKKQRNEEESEDRLALSATSSTTTVEVVNETAGKKKNDGCWKKFCVYKKKSEKNGTEDLTRETTKTNSKNVGATISKQGKCYACLYKIFCCHSSNKIETSKNAGMDEKKSTLCSCFPCRRERINAASGSTNAWIDSEQDISTSVSAMQESQVRATSIAPKNQVKGSCCKCLWSELLCCCRKQATAISSSNRRVSIKAPPLSSDDTRRKLHVDLVEYTSKMKGAIPVLPLYLAWFCAICNAIVPGLGTLFSGIFCICVGIPRFSQYDSAKARLGSFIINTVVACAQLFCVLFCLVGWGWSIWWGTIMLKCARKLNKIKKVERFEKEEEHRQAIEAASTERAAVLNSEIAKS